MDARDAMDAADIVWDRALDVLMSDAQTMAETEGILVGDRMLADAIHVDGCFQRSGADHMPDLDDAEREAGVAALLWFGLDAAADIIDDYVEAARRGKRSGRRENKATTAYFALDVEEQMRTRLRTRLEDTPGAFAPVDLPRPSRE